jgi:hypothetical protein
MKGVLLACLVALAFVLPACNRLNPTAPTDSPIITQFTADALSVKTGTPATLRWDVAGTGIDVRIDPAVGNVPQTGSTSVILTATTTFTLNARAKSGASSQRTLTIVVTP